MGSLTRRRKAASKLGEKALPPVFRLWMLRMLVLGGGQSNFIVSNGFCNDAVAEGLGVSHLAEDPEEDFSASAARAELKRLLSELERKTGRSSMPPLLSRNAKRLSIHKRLQLNLPVASPVHPKSRRPSRGNRPIARNPSFTGGRRRFAPPRLGRFQQAEGCHPRSAQR